MAVTPNAKRYRAPAEAGARTATSEPPHGPGRIEVAVHRSDGAAVEGTLVEVFAPEDGAAPPPKRTDAKGEALVPIARGGLMTLRLTHMTRPKAADYEWESFWATLTFRAP